MNSMNRIGRGALGAALCLALATIVVAGEPKKDQGPKAPPKFRITWWGSSSTGMLKRGIQNVLLDNDIIKIDYGKGGTGLRVDYLSKAIEAGDEKGLESFLGFVRRRAKHKDDFVIFQLSGGIFWTPESEKHVPRILDEICTAITKGGAKPLIFAHWTSRKPGKMREYAITAARKHKGRVAFCSSAAAEVIAEKGKNYIGKGEGHAWPKGIYLWTCCMYATLTGKSPIGLPAPKGALVDEAALPEDESSKVKGNPKETKASSAKDKFTKADLLYLQTKAWDVYQKYNQLLEAPAKKASGILPGPPSSGSPKS